MRPTAFAALLFLFLFCNAFGLAWAQKIKYEKGSLEEVLAKAKAANKPVFMVLEMSPAVAAAIEANNRKFPNGLDSQKAALVYNSQFLNVKVPHNSSDGAAVRQKYQVTQFPSYLYLNPDGQLVHRAFGFSPAPEKFLNDIKAFKTAASGTNTLSYFAREYANGKRNPDFLRQYLQVYKKMGQVIPQELVNAYATSLPVSAFGDFATVKFILEHGPVVDSEAYRLARSNKSVLDSIYKTLPLQQRLAINNGIIKNTMQLARDGKDRNLAWKGANFARSTHSNITAGQRVYERNMITFYKDIQDTASYLPQAARYYDSYFMTLSVDSVKRIVARETAEEQKRMANAAAASSEKKPTARPMPGKPVYTQRYVIGNPVSSHLGSLNDAAYSFFLSGTTNVRYLASALSWSKRTVELAPTSVAFQDTYAHLLYRLQLFTEAEAAQQKAIELAKKEKTATQTLEQSLQKMRTRTL